MHSANNNAPVILVCPVHSSEKKAHRGALEPTADWHHTEGGGELLYPSNRTLRECCGAIVLLPNPERRADTLLGQSQERQRRHGLARRQPQAQGPWICGQFAWRRNGPLAVGNKNAVIHRAALCPQIHRPPRARSFFYLGFKVKSSSRRIKPGWPRAFLARAIRNYASDSVPHSSVRLQRRISSRMSSTRHAVMRAPSVRTGRG